jgi:hypothetical protein
MQFLAQFLPLVAYPMKHCVVHRFKFFTSRRFTFFPTYRHQNGELVFPGNLESRKMFYRSYLESSVSHNSANTFSCAFLLQFKVIKYFGAPC